MKTTLEISNGVKLYRLSPFDDEIFLENECGEAMTLSEKELFDLIDEFFERKF